MVYIVLLTVRLILWDGDSCDSMVPYPTFIIVRYEIYEQLRAIPG
jgi:hypothetical protein